MSYVDIIIFDAGGHTGNTYYYRIVISNSGYVWDAVAEEMVAPDVGIWEDTAIELVEQGTTGQFPIAIPADIPAGDKYDIIIYKKDGSIPQNTDDVERQMQITKGGIFGF